jgi:HK97 family phage portal protein
MSGRRYRILHSNMTLDREEILHITELLLPGHLRGVSRIDKAKESLGLSQALTEFSARFFGNGAYAGGVIEYPGDLTPEQQQMLRDSWDGAHRGVHRSHRPAVLFGGAKYTPTMVNPSDSQLLDERKFAVQEIARIFRVPLFMLSVSEPGAVSYASVEQQMQWFVSTTIQTYAQKLETAFSQLLTRRDSFIKFNLNSLVRADLQTRTAAYSSALSAGWMSVNDVRGLEDLRPVEDGDQYRVPLQNVPLTDAPVITIAEKAKAAQALTTAGFTGDSIARLLDLPLEHTGQASVQVQPMMEGEG